MRASLDATAGEAASGSRLQSGGRSGGGVERTALAHPEQCLVELPQERRPVAVLEWLDERATSRIRHRSRRRRLHLASPVSSTCSVARSPGSVSSSTAARRGHVSPSSASERGAQLLGAERLVLEQRQLPAVERLGERAVGVGEAEPHEQLAGERAAERVEPRGLARGLRRRDREHRPDAVRPAVERLEEDRAGRERRCGREPDRADRVGDLGGRIRRILGPASAARSSSTQ